MLERLSDAQLSTFHSSAKKALLRSPEMAAQGVLNFVEAMPEGKDALCDEFLTSLTGCLTSSNEQVSILSLEACACIAKVRRKRVPHHSLDFIGHRLDHQQFGGGQVDELSTHHAHKR